MAVFLQKRAQLLKNLQNLRILNRVLRLFAEFNIIFMLTFQTNDA